MFVWTQDGAQGQWSRSALPTFGDVVWRVSWSVAGNVLAVSSGKSGSGVAGHEGVVVMLTWLYVVVTGDGKVTLWKENLKGEFEEVSVRFTIARFSGCWLRSLRPPPPSFAGVDFITSWPAFPRLFCAATRSDDH